MSLKMQSVLRLLFICLRQSEFTFSSLITSSLIVQHYWNKEEGDDESGRGLFVTDVND